MFDLKTLNDWEWTICAKYIMLIITYSWNLKKPILFSPEFIWFQLPNINCSCALSDIFPFRSFHNCCPSIFFLSPALTKWHFCCASWWDRFLSALLLYKCCSLLVPCGERGEQQCRTGFGIASLLKYWTHNPKAVAEQCWLYFPLCYFVTCWLV